MVTCEDDFELTRFSCYLGKLYGLKLSMHLRNKHDYLGVDMEFCNDGALEVSIFKYLQNVIDEFLEVIEGSAQISEWNKRSQVQANGGEPRYVEVVRGRITQHSLGH